MSPEFELTVGTAYLLIALVPQNGDYLWHDVLLAFGGGLFIACGLIAKGWIAA